MKRYCWPAVLFLILSLFTLSAARAESQATNLDELKMLCERLSNINTNLWNNYESARQELNSCKKDLEKLKAESQQAKQLLQKANNLLAECEKSLKTLEKKNHVLKWQRNIAYMISFIVLIIR